MSGYSNYTTYSSTEQSYGGMYSTGEYSSITSGGGFIKSEEGSSFSKGSQGNDRRNNNLRPVTIKQLHEATQVNDNSILIDGLELRVVKVVGVVKEKTPRHQGIDYVVDDGTGFIDVKVWHDESEETNVNKKIDIAINTYGKFFGHCRIFNNKKHVAAHVVHPIVDHNEISYHMAEVIYAHLYLTKALNNPSANQSSNQLTSTTSTYEYQARSSPGHVNQQLHKDIFDLISKQNNTQIGANIDEIAQQLAFQYGSDEAVRFAIEDMIGDGQLYVTSDDNHVKTTGN
ncbi:hypothetical protein RclHR1_06000013 [Rhizophagus clarus]|uniref:Replication protein A 32 kDa subunit B n=1 Tax=Rhizophagus clarus TaxID=94130 RepID=A0A2Z6SHM4_9GLOM|nr:hypothetical protein RclHR1_06000013 [Rhizophagus clarus]GES92703.1 replication protein A 32 kDa subunit B [Rhizophagus clarus]